MELLPETNVVKNWKSFTRLADLPYDNVVEDRVQQCPDVILEFQYEIVTLVFRSANTIRAYSNYFVDISEESVFLCLTELGLNWHLELFNFNELTD